MLKAIFFDLDDTLLWDSKSVSEAFKATCNRVLEKYNIDPRQLEKEVRKSAERLYPTYETYDFVKDIGIGVFEAMWGEFLDEGENFAKLREIVPRSEEHTSELQSRENLVCRLLLEKKKNKAT